MSKENIQDKYHESLKERSITDPYKELAERLNGVKQSQECQCGLYNRTRKLDTQPNQKRAETATR